MHTRKRLALTLLFLGSTALAQATSEPVIPKVVEPPHILKPGWTRIATPEFKLEFPANVPAQQVKSEVAGTSFVLFSYQIIIQGALYMVSYIDYPPESFSGAVPRSVLDHARDGAVAGVKGTLQKESEVELKSAGSGMKWPGRQLEATTAAGFPMSGRLYLVANRLYQFIVVFPKGPTDRQTFERMAASLRVTK